MAKVVYNACYGGFGLSPAATERYAEIKGIALYQRQDRFSFIVYYTDPGFNEFFWDRDLDRHDPALVQVVEELGELANGDCARLRIEAVPTGTAYRIDEYDGKESVITNDSYGWIVAP